MHATLKKADPKEKSYIILRVHFWCVSKLKTEKCAHWLYHAPSDLQNRLQDFYKI